MRGVLATGAVFWRREAGESPPPAAWGGQTRVGTAPGPLPTPKPAWERLVPPPVGTFLAGTQTPGTSHILLQIIIYFFFNRYKNRLWNRLRSGSPSGLSAKTGTAVASPSPQTIIYPLQKQRVCTKAPCAAVPAAVESLMPQKQNQNQAPRRPRAAQRPSRATSARSPRPHAAPRPGALGQRPTGPRRGRGSASCRAHRRCARAAPSSSPVQKKN